MKIIKITKLLILLGVSLCAEELVYGQNDVHAFLPKEKDIDLSISLSKVNDTLDIFNIKESEFGSSGLDTKSLGDMDGVKIDLGYTFDDKLYLHSSFSQKKLEYSGSTLVNYNLDLYLRYQFYNQENMAFSIDGGYTSNSAKDTYIRDIKSINRVLKNFSSGKNIKIKEVDDYYRVSYQDKNGVIRSLDLKNKPYIAIVNTDDESFYSRVIGSLKKEKWLFDTYLGYREIKIQNQTDSSLLDEADPKLKKELSKINFSQNRTDGMLFGGIGVAYKIDDKFDTAFNYQYNKMLRIDCLEETEMNHIFNVDLSYKIEKDWSIFIKTQLMLNQFNGEIPYLYSNYTKTTFDHKYGFVRLGVNHAFHR